MDVLFQSSQGELSFLADDSTQDSNSSTSTHLVFAQSASEMSQGSISQSVESMDAQSNQSSPENDKASLLCPIHLLLFLGSHVIANLLAFCLVLFVCRTARWQMLSVKRCNL